MSKSSLAVKKLRQNFIRRNQIDPNFFVYTDNNTDYYEIAEDFASANDNAIPIKNTLHRPKQGRPFSHQRQHSTINLLHFSEKQARISNPELKVILVKGKAVPRQPHLPRPTRQKNNSGQLSTRSSPLVHHRSQTVIKIEHRPRSAHSLVRQRAWGQSRAPSAGKERVRKRSDFLKPWEVDEEQYFTCWR